MMTITETVSYVSCDSCWRKRYCLHCFHRGVPIMVCQLCIADMKRYFTASFAALKDKGEVT